MKFQFRLSTAILLMFVAGLLMCNFFRERSGGFYARSSWYNDDKKYHVWKIIQVGWPLPIQKNINEDFSGFNPEEISRVDLVYFEGPWQVTLILVVDIAAFVAMLAVSGVGIEFVIRRGMARKKWFGN
jgi:uncharacterized integral membrane protein